MRRVVGIGALATALALAGAAAAASPFEGLWTGPAAGSRYLIVGVDEGGGLEVRAAASFSLENGCRVAAGDVLDRLAAQPDGTFAVTYAFFRSLPGNPPGPRGDHCTTEQRGPEPYALRLDPQSRLQWSCRGSTTAFCVTWSPTSATDTTAPNAKALPSRGRPGGVARLLYTASDDSGRTREVIDVLRGTKLLARGTTRLGPSKAGQSYAYSLRARGRLTGELVFCVTAIDAAGNASPRSCAPLTIG